MITRYFELISALETIKNILRDDLSPEEKNLLSARLEIARKDATESLGDGEYQLIKCRYNGETRIGYVGATTEYGIKIHPIENPLSSFTITHTEYNKIIEETD